MVGTEDKDINKIRAPFGIFFLLTKKRIIPLFIIYFGHIMMKVHLKSDLFGSV